MMLNRQLYASIACYLNEPWSSAQKTVCNKTLLGFRVCSIVTLCLAAVERSRMMGKREGCEPPAGPTLHTFPSQQRTDRLTLNYK